MQYLLAGCNLSNRMAFVSGSPTLVTGTALGDTAVTVSFVNDVSSSLSGASRSQRVGG